MKELRPIDKTELSKVEGGSIIMLGYGIYLLYGKCYEHGHNNP